IAGSGDPFFVWKDAIVLGNTLNELGIRKVTGNLLIVGNFAMNFKSDPAVAGELLKLGLNSRLWTVAVRNQYETLPQGTPKPEVAIAGAVKVQEQFSPDAKLLLRHQSMTLTEILKQMNIYSNNKMAEMLAQTVGGGKVVAQIAAKAAKVPPEEIQLINGSGLGLDNRISPRAACAMLMAIQRLLQSTDVGVTDLFPVAGRDTHGTMENRQIPEGTAVKTGTLNQVSALAGVIPTEERGLVWFAIVNSGSQIPTFRQEQDRLLQRLAQHFSNQ
ncbi:MAG: D-alanyl-D-alanine carboxypeptidase, partial [Prochloron sp. SP5CPC1]|nr:D-alanyl-D-alanine carboxypeptidase [Candidatus Paraprochloron terpiosi SP5CPC1]